MTPTTTTETSTLPPRSPEPEADPAIDTDVRIARAITRLETALVARPGFGRRTDVSATVLGPGLRCTTVVGDHRVDADVPAGLGGDATAPTPGALARAALGSCLAMGYRMRAARHGVHLASIEVAVETDSDIAGLIDLDAAVAAGFVDVRYRVHIVSDAPMERVAELVEEADRLSPMLDLFTRANGVRRVSTSVEVTVPVASDPDGTP